MLASPGVITPLFESLFIRSHGVTDINSSTEGEESIGAIGGGLLTLAMAYMGNQPDFKSYPRFVKPEPVEEERDSSNPFSAYNDEPKPRIPSMDHHAAMKEFFGVEIEHGMHGNFDPELPAYGVFFANDYDDLNWQQVSRLLTKKVNALFHVALPKGWDASDGKKQMAQTPRFYSLGKRKGPPIRRKRPVFEPF